MWPILWPNWLQIILFGSSGKDKCRLFIIAEAGVNHNGSVELAKKLIDVAVESEVDAIKFQTFKTENLVSRKATKADYQKHLGIQQKAMWML